jgi:hypothetical protein
MYPLQRRLGGPQGPVRKISPLPGFDPRTVQPAASRNAIQANKQLNIPSSTWLFIELFIEYLIVY